MKDKDLFQIFPISESGFIFSRPYPGFHPGLCCAALSALDIVHLSPDSEIGDDAKKDAGCRARGSVIIYLKQLGAPQVVDMHDADHSPFFVNDHQARDLQLFHPRERHGSKLIRRNGPRVFRHDSTGRKLERIGRFL